MPTADRLIHSLRAQPLLVVLRPSSPRLAGPQLERLSRWGIRHVEIAWQSGPRWVEEMEALVGSFADLELGAASVCEPEGVAAAAAAGCHYAVSPVLDPALLHAAAERDLVLVPGVMTASEVHAARRVGCRLVKLFPAVSVGIDHWRRLREPLGSPLPFCIAAGGLGPADVLPWLKAGVDAVALGSGLGAVLGDPAGAGDGAGWPELLAALPRPPAGPESRPERCETCPATV